MSVAAPRAYRFATAAQWGRCLAHRLEARSDGIGPIPRIGSRVVPVGERHAVGVVAADPHGRPTWSLPRGDEGGGPFLVRLDDAGSASAPFEVDETLGGSPRLVLDREWLWAFSASRVRRYRVATLQLDRTFGLSDLLTGHRHGGAGAVHDIASDGRDGLWILASAADGTQWLMHLDRKGCRREILAVPCCACEVSSIGTLERGRVLALLARRQSVLTLLSATDGTVRRVIQLRGLAPCWSPEGLATDVGRRMAIWGTQRARPDLDGKWLLFVLGPTGDVVDGPLSDFVAPPEPGRGPLPRRVARPSGAAVGRDRVWLASGEGLWQLDAGSGRDAALSADGTLVTPRLQSPRTSTSRGWLRAELAADLPQGAVIEAEFASTDDRELADRVAALAADASTSAEVRQQAIWSLLEHPASRRFVVAGPTTADDPVAIPLFASQDEWLWLRVRIVIPPGTSPRPIRELRVLYPDESIARHLPAVFRTEQRDPGGVLRRLVGVLETTTQRLDDRIGSIGTLLDAGTAPEGWLDYMARWLDLPWDDGLDLEAKRRLVGAAGDVLGGRGTRAGLRTLLRAILGAEAHVRVVDLTVEHPPARLASRGPNVRGTATLPLLLAGPPRGLPILGSRAVLGRTRPVAKRFAVDPLSAIVPTVEIAVAAPRALRARAEPVLQRLVAQYVPAGLRVALRWLSPGGELRDFGNTDVVVLDGPTPATVGVTTEIGRAVLGGRPGIGGADIGMDHRLS